MTTTLLPTIPAPVPEVLDLTEFEHEFQDWYQLLNNRGRMLARAAGDINTNVKFRIVKSGMARTVLRESDKYVATLCKDKAVAKGDVVNVKVGCGCTCPRHHPKGQA